MCRWKGKPMALSRDALGTGAKRFQGRVSVRKVTVRHQRGVHFDSLANNDAADLPDACEGAQAPKSVATVPVRADGLASIGVLVP